MKKPHKEYKQTDTVSIGLGHYSRTGKDELGKKLVEYFGVQGLSADTMSFASVLKDTVCKTYPWLDLPSEMEVEEHPQLRNLIYSNFSHTNYDDFPNSETRVKNGVFTVVDLWIYFGTHVMRELDPDFWVDQAALKAPEVDVVIFTDFRFPNELKIVDHPIRVMKPGVEPRPGSVDDRLLDFDNWLLTIHNDGSLDDLNKACPEVEKAILGPQRNLEFSCKSGKTS